MVVSRFLPVFLYCIQVVFRVFANRRIHMRTQNRNAGIIRHLLEVHQFDITDLAFPITGKFDGLIPHLFQLLHSSRNILVELVA